MTSSGGHQVLAVLGPGFELINGIFTRVLVGGGGGGGEIAGQILMTTSEGRDRVFDDSLGDRFLVNRLLYRDAVFGSATAGRVLKEGGKQGGRTSDFARTPGCS